MNDVGKKNALEAISKLLVKIPQLREVPEDSLLYRQWKDEADAKIKFIFGDMDITYIEFHKNLFPHYFPPLSGERNVDYRMAYLRRLDTYESKLQAMRSVVEMWSCDEKTNNNDVVHNLVNILSKFHIFARQLKRRHDDRQTIVVTDEYDVQDLVHAVLRLLFEDVRAEEYTPSYAGSSSRIDFLIKDESIGVEIKKTRHGLRDRELGEQLIIDKERYKSHHNCKNLICFIFDPDGLISNPPGLIRDLGGLQDGMNTYIVISPL